MSDNEEPQRGEGSQEQTLQDGLEETQRLTTQWSVEDEEEAARERRRRERQQQLGSEGQSPDDLDEETCTQTDNHVGLKPAGPWETEEDEGFSDWSQKLVQRKQRGAAQAAEETEEPRFRDTEQTEQTRATEEFQPYTTEAQVEEEDEGTTRNEEVEANDEPEQCTEETEVISYSQWETREINYEEDRPPRVPEREVEEQEEQEDRHVPVGDLVQTEHYENQWVSDEVEVRRQSESIDGEEGDDAITVKVTERAEILTRSIQKSNSIKRSEPPLPIHKIDDRLEQYTHAIETSTKQGRLVRQPSLEMLNPADAVTNIKNRWETGDVTAATKASSCKDTDGINIGVSDMINQWGKGKPEVEPGQTSPTKVTEVKPGEVLSKKSIWEHGPKSGQINKNATPNKKYKFVPVGHGKYEKVLVDEP